MSSLEELLGRQHWRWWENKQAMLCAETETHWAQGCWGQNVCGVLCEANECGDVTVQPVKLPLTAPAVTYQRAYLESWLFHVPSKVEKPWERNQAFGPAPAHPRGRASAWKPSLSTPWLLWSLGREATEENISFSFYHSFSRLPGLWAENTTNLKNIYREAVNIQKLWIRKAAREAQDSKQGRSKQVRWGGNERAC